LPHHLHEVQENDFKYIVHYDKIAGYNAVNLLNGYRPVQIFSPKEIVEP